MRVDLTHTILAIVTDRGTDSLEAGGAPLFRIHDPIERQRIAQSMAASMVASVHEVPHGTYLIVKH